jgi:hypothetical protein
VIKHAEWQFGRLQKVGGAPVADHLAVVTKQTGKKITTQAAPDLPTHGYHLWAIFLELHSARGGNGYSPNPIGFSELVAWQQLREWPLDSWEVEAIRQIDAAYLAAWAKAKAPPPGKGRVTNGR